MLSIHADAKHEALFQDRIHQNSSKTQRPFAPLSLQSLFFRWSPRVRDSLPPFSVRTLPGHIFGATRPQFGFWLLGCCSHHRSCGSPVEPIHGSTLADCPQWALKEQVPQAPSDGRAGSGALVAAAPGDEGFFSSGRPSFAGCEKSANDQTM